MTDEALNPRQAARYLGCQDSTLRAWRASGFGPGFYRLGRLIRYRRAELDRWITANSTHPNPVVRDGLGD